MPAIPHTEEFHAEIANRYGLFLGPVKAPVIAEVHFKRVYSGEDDFDGVEITHVIADDAEGREVDVLLLLNPDELAALQSQAEEHERNWRD